MNTKHVVIAIVAGSVILASAIVVAAVIARGGKNEKETKTIEIDWYSNAEKRAEIDLARTIAEVELKEIIAKYQADKKMPTPSDEGPFDPWMVRMKFEVHPEISSVTLTSSGPDKKFATTDDIFTVKSLIHHAAP